MDEREPEHDRGEPGNDLCGAEGDREANLFGKARMKQRSPAEKRTLPESGRAGIAHRTFRPAESASRRRST